MKNPARNNMLNIQTIIRSSFSSYVLIIQVLLLFTSPAWADVKLSHIFGDHMVLQREKPIKIWGWAKPGEKITVSFADQVKVIETSGNGDWSIKLNPMKASFKGYDLIVKGKNNTIKFTDILVGEVWICGGQSNMEFQLRSTRDADLELPCANYPAMRFIRIPHIARMKPQQDFPVTDSKSLEGNWRLCITEQVSNCSGVGYYFARRLHRRLKVPVGLIDTSWGGTMAQHWASKKTLLKFPEMAIYFDKFEKNLQAWIKGGREEGAKKRYESDLQEWRKKRDAAMAEGKRIPGKPRLNSYSNPANKRQPGGMFNGMIVPISNFTLRGALFYQGENNSFTEAWKPFHNTFPAVITDWRKIFGDKDMPFGIIQIAGWSTRRTMKYDMNHHTNIIREIQFITWRKTPNTGLIVTFDTNTTEGIHPARKMPVGERSARWALSQVYKIKRWHSSLPVEWRGPVYKSMEIKDGKIIISFEKGTNHRLILDKDEELGFYISGKDRIFHHARARIIRDDKLLVWSEEVPEPVAVRYGWSNLPTGSLMNSRQLPAYPFRTDTWPLVPHQSTGAYEVNKY